MVINKAHIRQLHSWFAPIMLLPVLLTLTTGSLFQVAVLTGKGNEFLWLLDLHRGKFGQINLEIIYPFLNAFGILSLAITGITIWFQTRRRSPRRQ
ncbi:MAG: PepSY domain-containing protein [Coleofasciculaceae cyanobacterium]